MIMSAELKLVSAENDFISGAPGREFSMPIIKNQDGTTTLIHRYRRNGKEGGTTKRRTIPTQDHRQIAIEWGRLISEVEGPNDGGSLTSATFSECIDHCTRINGGAGMASVYKRLKEALGKQRIADTFPHHFYRYLAELKTKGYAENTISNYKSATQTALKRARAAGLIKDIPIHDFEVRRTFRSRVWTADERTRIFDQLDKSETLYWMIRFMEKNPIRKSDIVRLTRNNLVLVGPHAPYIRYQPRKTERSRPKPAILREIDADMLDFWESIAKAFPDCPYLFPRIIHNRRAKSVRWAFQGNFRGAFEAICRLAEVHDFHIHDLKHVSITYMLTRTNSLGVSVYSRNSLKKLGIQHSDRSIDVYDESGAWDELNRIKQAISVSHDTEGKSQKAREHWGLACGAQC